MTALELYAGAGQGTFERLMSTQRVFMDTYGESLEQLLSVLVYMVPVQEEEEDLTGFWSQVVYSTIDLFNMYRTVLLREPAVVPVALPTNGDRPTVSLQQLRRRYTMSAFTLRAIRSVQVLVEMRATKTRGADHALKVCMQLEIVKLILKMILRTAMPFSIYVDEDALEEVDPPKTRAGTLARQSYLTDGVQVVPGADQAFVGRRTGKALRALTTTGLCGNVSPSSTRLLLAEALFHGRPLVHLFLLRRRGVKSWFAWFFAAVVDRVSVALLQSGINPTANTRAAALELAEVRRRSWLALYAFARSPCFERFLQRPSVLLNSVISRIPVLNLFNFVELFLALQPFYFTTSGS